MPTPPIRKVKNWNIRFVNSQAAWTPLLDTSSPTGFNYGDIEIAHIDTGYLRHDAFGPWEGDKNDQVSLNRGINLIEEGTLPIDPLTGGHRGHGTRIGSVMCGYDPDIMVGVAPRAPVIPYRAIDFTALLDAGAVNRVAKAIQYAIENKCSVINLSLGTKPIFPLISDLVDSGFKKDVEGLGAVCDEAYEKGVIIVAALGNNIHDRATKPGKYYRTICAGGLEPVFESQGLVRVEEWKPQANPLDAGDYAHIDVWAPADDIFRARASRPADGPQDAYWPTADGEGTSYAAAAVSGAAAIWLARRAEEIGTAYPEESPWMKVEAFRELLKTSGQGEPANAHRNNHAQMLDVSTLVEADLPAAESLIREDRLCANMLY